MSNAPGPATAGPARHQLKPHLIRNGLIAAAILALSLVIGMAGYHWLGPMPWLDAFVNASMILGGMGPVTPLENRAIKAFAGVYALYCGVVFIAGIGLLLAPVAFNVLHRFHLDQKK